MPKGITPLLFFIFLILLVARSAQYIFRIFQESTLPIGVSAPTDLCDEVHPQLSSDDRYRRNYFLLDTRCDVK